MNNDDDDKFETFWDTDDRHSEGEEDEELDNEEFPHDYPLYPSEIDIELRVSDIQSNLNLHETEKKSPELSAIEKRLHTIAQLKELWDQQRELKLENNLLHKKCRDYLIESKVSKCFEKSLIASDIHSNVRYEAILDEYKTMEKCLDETKLNYTNELEAINNIYQTHFAEFQQIFQAFRSREMEIGVECYESENSKERHKKTKNALKIVSTVLNRQEQRLNSLVTVRIKYLKLHHWLENLQVKFNKLNTLDDEHTLIDYEILLMNKDASIERLDQRHEDLKKVRDKFFSIAHTLAHAKEASVALVMDIEMSNKQLTELEKVKHEKYVEFIDKGKQRDALRRRVSTTRNINFIKNSLM